MFHASFPSLFLPLGCHQEVLSRDISFVEMAWNFLSLSLSNFTALLLLLQTNERNRKEGRILKDVSFSLSLSVLYPGKRGREIAVHAVYVQTVLLGNRRRRKRT